MHHARRSLGLRGKSFRQAGLLLGPLQMVHVLGVLILVSVALDAPFPVFWGVAYSAMLALGAWGAAILVIRAVREMPAWIMVPASLSAMILSLWLGSVVYWQDLLTTP